MGKETKYASGKTPAQKAGTHNFELGGIVFELEYKSTRALRLTVYPPDGRVKITAPAGSTPDSIGEFAASKIEWIKKHKERFRNHQADPKPALSGTLRNHSKVYVWGRPHELEIIERGGNPKIVIEGEHMKMYVRPNSPKAKLQEIFNRWYRRSLKEAAPPIIKKWEAVLGIEVKKLYIRKMKSHWGSCNYQRQTLRLNSELVKRSPECLEYVIVHEMLHIIEKGHNKRFYRLLNRYIPDWKAIRKGMNSGGL